MAALILCGLWALTLAAPDEPIRVVAPPQMAPRDRVEAAVPAPNVVPEAAPLAAAPRKPPCRPA
jgi:hypothetical protein